MVTSEGRRQKVGVVAMAEMRVRAEGDGEIQG